jgi:excisionase family DNA binding protein
MSVELLVERTADAAAAPTEITIAISQAEAARALRISERTLYQLRKDGHIRAVLFRGSVRYLVDDLRDLAVRMREKAFSNLGETT